MVKEGTSFAFAAGARSKPAPAAAGAENGGGEDEGTRNGGRGSHAEKRAGSQGKKRVDGEGKKGNKRGQAGAAGTRAVWAAALDGVGARRRPSRSSRRPRASFPRRRSRRRPSFL